MKKSKSKWEGSKADEKMDKKAAKVFGMSEKAYERSAIDKAADRLGQKKMNKKAKK